MLERDLSLRTGLSCLQGQRRVFSLLDKLKAASLLRLELSQTIQDSLRSKDLTGHPALREIKISVGSDFI